MSGASPVSVPAARCVLWHPRGSPPLDELLEALHRRGVTWTATDRCLTALVETLSPPPTPAVAPHPIPTVLVFIDPPRLRSLDDVLDVVARYRPRTALWVFDLAEPSRLRSMQALEILAKYVPTKLDQPVGSPRADREVEDPPDAATTGWRLKLTEQPSDRPVPSNPPTSDRPPSAIDSRRPASSSEARSAKDSPTYPSGTSGADGFRSVMM